MAEEISKVTSFATLVKEIKLSSSPEQVSLAYKLEDLLWHMDRSESDVIDRDTIDEIALMLSNQDEALVMAACGFRHLQ